VRAIAPKTKLRTLYLESLLAIAAAAFAGSYFLAKPGPERAGAWSGIGASALVGLPALYLKKWAIQQSLKRSLAIIGILFAIRLILLAVGLGLSSTLGLNGVAFAVGFLSVYFVVQWIEIGYLTYEQNRAHREGR
jgi:hypothetical protein